MDDALIRVLVGAVSGMAAAIASLAAILRFYIVPRSRSNPATHDALVELLALTKTHDELAQERHRELLAALNRIEEKIK